MFSQIAGYGHLTDRLRKAVSAPGHAYIFAGEDEGARKALAAAFAKALQCAGTSDDKTDACGICLSCRVFESGNHPDVFYVKSGKAKGIGVEDVRSQIVVPMNEKPFRYPYKIFIVEEPLTHQAQNALLKTIEEPAPFGIFLFLIETISLFLPTVLSRCAVLKLNPLPEPQVSHAAQSNIDPQTEIEMQNFAKTTADNIEGMDILAVFSLCSQFEKWKDYIQVLLDMLYLNCRLQLDGAVNTEAPLLRLEAVYEAKKALKQNGNFQMNIETMLIKMSRP